MTPDSSGNLLTNGTLNAETSPTYSLTVTAASSEGFTNQETVTVDDLAAFAPVFASPPSLSVVETAAVGTTVGSVSATDPDGGNVSYFVSGGPFSIDSSGDIMTTQLLNVVTMPSYSLTVDAISPNGWESVEQVSVRTTAAQLPVFNSGVTTISGVGENVPTGTDLGNLEATDPDGQTLTYAVSGGPFTVSSAGDLVTTGPLNAESSPSYAADHRGD